MSFFLDGDPSTDVCADGGACETTFNFFGSANNEKDDSHTSFNAMFPETTGDDGSASSNSRFNSLQDCDNEIGRKISTKSLPAAKQDVAHLINRKKSDVSSSSRVKELQNTQSQIKSLDAITTARTSVSTSDIQDSESPDIKRVRLAGNAPIRTQPKALQGQYSHPMQLKNETSPENTRFQLPQLQAPKPGITSSSSAKALVSNHSILGGTHANKEVKVSNSQPTDTAALSMALNLSEYESLKEQLANLPTAKQAGTFTHQVAASVDALFKCVDMRKSREWASHQDDDTKFQDKVRSTHEEFSSQLKEANTYYQTIVDSKLSKLSTVLDEIKSNQSELTKYRQLICSLSVDLSQEQ